MIKNTFVKLHLSVLLAGTTGIFGRLISLESMILVWYRMVIAALILFLIMKAQKGFRSLPMKETAGIMGTGCLLAIHWVLFFGSIKASNVSIGVICFSLVSLFTAILEPVVNRHRIALSEILFSMITFSGILFIFGFDSRYRLGIGLGILSSAVAALFTIFNKRASLKQPSSTLTLYEMAGGALILTVLNAISLPFSSSMDLLPPAKDLIYLLILSSVCTLGPYILQIQVLRKIPAFTMNLTYNLEPVYSIIFAMLIFKENKELETSFYIGLLIIALSVLLQSLYTIRKQKE